MGDIDALHDTFIIFRIVAVEPLWLFDAGSIPPLFPGLFAEESLPLAPL